MTAPQPKQNRWRWPFWGFGAGLLAGLLVWIGMLTGSFLPVRWPNSNGAAIAPPAAAVTSSLAEQLGIPAHRLHAASADSGESFAVATGAIDQDAEGLFLLDYETGELQCVVLNYRFGRFNAIYRTNVIADLGMENSKRPEYIMVTGMINFQRGVGAARPSQSAVYVVDGNTGNYVAYAVPWIREANQVGRPQMGGLVRLDVGTARLAGQPQ